MFDSGEGYEPTGGGGASIEGLDLVPVQVHERCDRREERMRGDLHLERISEGSASVRDVPLHVLVIA